MANTYKYIDQQGKEATYDAATPEEAIRGTASSRRPDSGVQLFSRLNPGTPLPTPGQATAAPAAQNPLLGAVSAPRTPTSLDAARTSLEKTLAASPVEPNESAIREQARLRSQAIIDEINAQFAGRYRDAEIAGDRRSRRAQALSANSNLRGSDFASARATEAETITARDKAMIDQEKFAKINETLLGIEERASKEYADKRASYLKEVDGNYQKVSEFQRAQSDTARNNAITLAQQGVSLAALRGQAPDVYAKLLEETGYEPAVFNAVYNSALPENQKRSYEYKTVGGKIYAVSYNPATRKIDSEEISTPGGFDQFMVTPDGTPIFVNKTSGKIQVAGGFNEGQFAKPAAPKGGGTGTNPTGMDAALADAYAAISAGANPDDVRRAFLGDFPGKASQFNAYTKVTKPAGARSI